MGAFQPHGYLIMTAKLPIIKTSDFYLEHSEWVDAHYFDEDGRPYRKTRKGLVPLTGVTTKSYPFTNLRKNDGTYHKMYLHRIVAMLFIPNPQNKEQVNHKNGDRKDFRVSNLEWVTNQENSIHSVKTKLKPRGGKQVKASNPNLNKELIFETSLECAEYFGVCPEAITVRIRDKVIFNGWHFEFANPEDDNTISWEEFETLLHEGKVKEHPRFLNYYGWFDKEQIVSLVGRKPRLIKLSIRDKYYVTSLRNFEGKREKVTLHRFLYECYHNMIVPKEIVIDHIDNDTFNNAIENLQTVTVAQNSAKATSHPIRLNFTDGTSKDFSSIKEAAEYLNIYWGIIADWKSGRLKSYRKYGVQSVVSLD